MDDESETLREVAELEEALQQAQDALAALLRGMRHGGTNLRALWRTAWEGALREAAATLGPTAADALGRDALYGLGTVLGLAQGAGRPPEATFAHPAVPHPPGVIHPASLALLAADDPTEVGAPVDFPRPTPPDAEALAGAAERIAEAVCARLAFEDRRDGRA